MSKNILKFPQIQKTIKKSNDYFTEGVLQTFYPQVHAITKLFLRNNSIGEQSLLLL